MANCDFKVSDFYKKHIITIYALFIIILGYCIYMPVTKIYFNMDDIYNIKLALNPLNFKKFAFSLYSKEIGAIPASRPLTFLYSLLYYKLFNLTNYVIGHLLNITIHILNSFLVYLISFKLTRKKTVSFLSSCIFLLHNVNFFVLIGITYVSELCMSLFIYSALFFYIQFIEKRKIYLYFISLISFVIALGWKETAIVTPFILILYTIIYHPDAIRLKQTRGIMLHLASYIAILFIYLGYRLYLVGLPYASPQYRLNFNISSWPINILKYLILYLGISDYNLTLQSKITKIYLIIVVFLILLGVVLSVKKYKRPHLYALFLCIFPIICILPLHRDFPAQRYLYSSLIGFSIIASISVCSLTQFAIKNLAVKARDILIHLILLLFIFSLLLFNRYDMGFAMHKKYQAFIGMIAKNLVEDIKLLHPAVKKGSSFYILNTDEDFWSPPFVNYFRLTYNDLSLEIKMDKYDELQKYNMENEYILKHYKGHLYDINKEAAGDSDYFDQKKYQIPPLTEDTKRYKPYIDFKNKINLNQLGFGWFLPVYGKNTEEVVGHDKWMSNSARVYLKTERGKDYIVVKGSAPFLNTLEVYINNILLKKSHLVNGENFEIREEVKLEAIENSFIVVDLKTSDYMIPNKIDKNNKDMRRLGVFITYIGLEDGRK